MIKKYPGYASIEPEDLFLFSEEYLKEISSFISELKTLKEKREVTTLSFTRIQPDGSIKEKSMSGFICEVDEQKRNFTFASLQFFDNEAINEDMVPILIRTDNVLGLIPKILRTGSPFSEEPSKKTRAYVAWLRNTMIPSLNSCIGKEHFVKFLWKYSKKNELFRNGNYYSEGEILQVNRSNVEFNHFGTFAKWGGERYVDIIPRISPNHEIDRFIAPDRFLYGVVIHFGTKGKIYSFDDEEY